MTQRVALLNGKNKNKDFDLSKIFEAFSDAGIVKGLDYENGYITPGYAFVEVEREGRRFCVLYENTESLPIDSNGTKKIFIEINNNNIIDGSRNNIDGTGIGSIKTASEFPSKNFLKIGRFENGNFISERKILKNFKNLNKNNSILVLDENGKIPVVNLPAMPIDINGFNEKNLEDDQYFPVYDVGDRENKKISVRELNNRFNNIETKQNFRSEVFHFSHKLNGDESEYILNHNLGKMPEIIHIFGTIIGIWVKGKQIGNSTIDHKNTTYPGTLNSFYSERNNVFEYKISEVTENYIKFVGRHRAITGGNDLNVNIGLIIIT